LEFVNFAKVNAQFGHTKLWYFPKLVTGEAVVDFFSLQSMLWFLFALSAGRRLLSRAGSLGDRGKVFTIQTSTFNQPCSETFINSWRHVFVSISSNLRKCSASTFHSPVDVWMAFLLLKAT
jgi:hypothetical protein